MKTLIAVFACSLLFSFSSLFGADYFNPASQVGTSAETIRIGNIEGFSTHANTIFENPAGLHRIRKLSVSMFTTTFMDEVVYFNGSMAFRLNSNMIGLGISSVGVSDLDYTQEVLSGNGETIFQKTGETFNYKNSVMKLAFQRSQSKNLHFGGSINFYNSDIATTNATGKNADFGILMESERLSVSIVMRNFLSSQKVNYSNGTSEDLPLESVYSARYSVGDLNWYGQLKLIGSDRKLAKSVAVSFNPSFMPIFTVSGGYKEFPIVRSIDGETEHIIDNSFTLGIGLDLMDVDFNYSYEASDHIEYSNKHYFSIGVKF